MAAANTYGVMILIIVVTTLITTLKATPPPPPPPPPIFIFGDSTADVGTNSFLEHSLGRADFPHNGIDFPHSRPTGRFSNGLNTADFIARFLGYNSSPLPFLYLDTIKYGLPYGAYRGVNFASAGSGLLDITGSTLKVVTMRDQLKQFDTVVQSFSAAIGPTSMETMLSKSLFFISTGSNDIFSYFFTNSTIPEHRFIGSLMEAYEDYIQILYRLGARKFGLVSVPPLGCCPATRLLNQTNGCFEPMNDFVTTFHSELEILMSSITSHFPGIKYSIGNTYQMTIDVLHNPIVSKFKVVDTACCGHGKLNAQGPCNSTAQVCAERRDYLFWDLYHPTQAASKTAAQTLFYGPTRYVTPINFSQLAQHNYYS